MKCGICEIGCRLGPGLSGSCGMYQNREGVLEERFPFSYIAALPVSIETIPMTHFHPRAKFLQLGGIGCNFSCMGCVSDLFTHHIDLFAPALTRFAPQHLVRQAKAMGCEGIVWCMNDPTVCHPSFLSLAAAGRSEGLLVGCSSNVYHTSQTLAQLAEAVDFVNCGLKGATDQAYRLCGVASADPVFRNIRFLHDAGIHIEISIMYAKGNESEVLLAAEKLAQISESIPMQIMRFLPFGEAPIHQEPTVLEAEALCRQVRTLLPYTYLFNTPGTSCLHTHCPQCGSLLVYRQFYGPMGCRLISYPPDGRCRCGHKLPLIGPVRDTAFEEFGMSGGYRFTRGLEIIRALCGILGITTQEEVSRVWHSAIAHNDIDQLHDKINRIDTYLDLITEMGCRFHRRDNASILRSYMEGRCSKVARAVRDGKKPRVYYAMSTPFFALNEDRLEVQLVTFAGGDCVNKRIQRSGKPGVNLSREELLHLNPEHIFVSGLLSSTADEFRNMCEADGIWVDAVRHGRIHVIRPGWDFGNPRWILGLMQIANALHPDRCDFDLDDEADHFYRTFYQAPPEQFVTNRSFYQETSIVHMGAASDSDWNGELYR
ncbi:Radical SAM domain protein [uncultured Desulfatiglans sp.]|nr:Radical SAM domain protein [uncultured Desulfatiglans sp.]